MTMLEPFKVWGSEVIAPSLVPEAAEALAMVDQLGDLSTGTPGVPWGATEEEVDAAVPRLKPIPPEEWDLRRMGSGSGMLLQFFGPRRNSKPVRRIKEGPGVLVYFEGGRFSSFIRELSEREYEACKVGLPIRLGDEAAAGDGIIGQGHHSSDSVPDAWKVGDTFVRLIHSVGALDVRHGLLQDAWNRYAGELSVLQPRPTAYSLIPRAAAR